jgi:hypothetical protein
MDYSQQIADLKAAAAICERHTITRPVNGIQPAYPRWPNAWAACEKVWRDYLELQTLDGPDGEQNQKALQDRQTVIDEARKLRR